MQLKIKLCWMCCLLWLLLALPWQTPSLHAQAAQSAATQSPTVQPSAVQPTTITEDQVNVVARELWCPLCSGVRLDACELKACDQMRQEIALKLAAGDNLEAIKSFFVAQYGPQVLGEPPRSGFNWLAWILPFAVLLAGALFLVMRGRKLLSVAPAVRGTPAASAADSPDQPYVHQLEEELKRYD